MELRESTPSALTAESRERFFQDLYEKTFPPFARLARKMNASFQDAKDVFHDALLIYYEKQNDPAFEVTTSPEAYVMGIAKHLWIRRYNHDRHHISLDSLEAAISLPADFLPTVNEARLLKFLEQTGARCLQLLRKFYFEKTSLKQIARSLGYSTEHSATVQKFKCISKMREAIKSRSIGYEDFLA